MPAGKWSFLQEFVIYEYLMHRYQEKQLRLKSIVKDSKMVLKEKYIKVKYLEEVKNGFFPDIDSIELFNDKKGRRPAEVKFTTSAFNYHNSQNHIEQYKQFINVNGCIIVLKHDTVPVDLLSKYIIDIYEIDLIDFVSFTKENFMRLLNRQIRAHEYNKKTWLMIQSRNFNCGTQEVKPARESGRWCPVDTLSGLELGIGDRIIFVKTKGASKQNVNKYWSRYNEVFQKWFLDELWIGEIISQIRSREEYNMIKGYSPNKPLWYDETVQGKNDNRITLRKNSKIRWRRVFEFKHIRTFNDLNINMADLYNENPELVRCVIDIFVGQGSREINEALYTTFIEYLADKEMKYRNTYFSLNKDDEYNNEDFIH